MSEVSAQEAANPVCGPVGAADEAEQELTRYHLVMFQQGGDFIDRIFLARVQEELDTVIATDPQHTGIDVWIDSPGGHADAAYKLVLDLRSRCTEIRAVVPDFAKSAATLLVLGTDCIFMSPAAELGPLDVQLGHPDREGVRVSGLDITDSLEFLGRTAIGLVITGGASLIEYTGLPRHDVLHEMLQFMAQFMQPAVSKLDPHLLHQAFSQLRVAGEYARRMLKSRNVGPHGHMGDAAVDSLLFRLVNDYPTHGFVIGRDEARELGLPVENAEEYPRWANVKDAHAYSFRKNTSLIHVCPDSELDKEGVEDVDEMQSFVESETSSENADNVESPSADSQAV